MTAVAVISGVLAGLVCLWWVLLSIRLARMLSSGFSLKRGLSAPVEYEPVSVIVPAHNEERVIGRCVDALTSQTWPDLQIVVVADRCTDATEQIVMERANDDGRILLVRNTECPENWAGKCHAARVGAEQSTGDWLIFMDADTTAHPELIRAALAEAQRRETSLLSLLTDLESSHWFERSTQPVMSMALMALFPPDRVNRDDTGRHFANGQFMLFDREVYEEMGGHALVSDDLLEDIAFAKRFGEAGHRVNVLRSSGLLGVSMYGSHEDFLRGWMRIFLEATNRTPKALRKQAWRQLIVGWLLPALCILAIVLGSVGSGASWVGWLGGAGLGLQVLALAWVYRIGRQPIWAVLLHPYGVWEVFKVLRWALRVLKTGEPVRWGGREYVVEPRGC